MDENQQFRHQLNQWFEQHGVLDNLRSHLRSIMVTALQQTEIRLRPNQKTTPKIQSVNLLVAEFLINHGCHYTLSVLMSELPALSSFASGGLLKTGKPREKYRFEEKEVVEMLNSLGVSSSDEIVKLVWDCYDRNKEEESLLECLLRFIPRCGPEALVEAQVRDGVKMDRERRHVTACQFLTRMSDCELKRAVEEENERRMTELIEREKRIQDCLRSHEEEIVRRLQSAEKELEVRRDTIDRELSERQVHLGRIAFQLKDKHNDILDLSRNFAAIKSENVALTSKLESVQLELRELRDELEKKNKMMDRMEAERMSMKCHVQEYLKWKKGGMEREVVTSNSHDGACPENEETLNSGSSQSSDEEVLLNKVKARVEKLDQEYGRIFEKYTKYKKKYELEDSDVEESCATVPDVESPECTTVAVAPVEPAIAEREEVEDCRQVTLNVPKCEESTPTKKPAVEEEEEEVHRRVLIPTKRQQKNLEYYLRSRSLVEALEKSAGLVNEGSSGSASDPSLSSVSEEGASRISEKLNVEENLRAEGKDAGMRDLSDLECLTLLKASTVKESPVEGDEGS